MTVLVTFAGLSDQPQFEAFPNLFKTNDLELWDRLHQQRQFKPRNGD